MEQWQDQGIVLAARRHGENGAVVSLLTEGHGRHAGYVRGAGSSRLRGVLEPGSLAGVRWQARAPGELGSYVLEQERNPAASLMDDPLRLSALLSACALCDSALPEREGHPGLYHGFLALLGALQEETWGAVYVMWEIAFLRELGFGLNLTRCAGGGDPATLCYVSPKSGHAVSVAAGEPYKDKLLPLPAFLRPERGGAGPEEVFKGLSLTGYFLEHWAFAQHTQGVPEARARLHDRYRRFAEEGGAVAV